jgi:hypothetical protein
VIANLPPNGTQPEAYALAMSVHFPSGLYIKSHIYHIYIYIYILCLSRAAFVLNVVGCFVVMLFLAKNMHNKSNLVTIEPEDSSNK